jgi:hypothetical protein
MARDDPQMKLRLTPEVKARIEEAARKNNRSLNGEIIARLEKSFEHDDAVSELLQRVEDLEGRVDVHEEVLGLRKERD